MLFTLVLKSNTVSLCPVGDMKHPFIQCLHAADTTSLLVT